MEELKTYFQNTQKAIDLIAGLILLFLPISPALPNILLVPLGLLVIFNFKKFNFVRSKTFFIYGLCILFLIFLAAIDGSLPEDLTLYSRFLLVLILFLLFTQVKNLRLVEHFLLIGIFIAFVGSAVAVAIYSFQNTGFLLDTGSAVNDLLWLERPYFGIMLSLGTFICFRNAEKYHKNDYYILALLFIGFSIYISARLSIFLNVLLILVFLLKSDQIQRGTKIGIAFIFALLVAIAFGLSDNLMSRMRITNDWDETKALIQDYEPRFVIWPCATEIVENETNLFIGLNGYEELEEKLTDCYASSIEKEDKRDYYLTRKFNTHNQFLDFLLVGGIFPFLLLLLLFLQGWFSGNPFEFKIILLMFFLFFLVENVLHRQLGCYLFGIFVALYSIRRNE